MKRLLHITVISAILIAAGGCRPESYSYRYQAGSWYEYQQLMKVWVPNNGILPPLPPDGDNSEPRWVKVSSSGRIEPEQGYLRRPNVYFTASYGHFRPYRRGYYSPYRHRYGRYGSGFSLGMHYGSRGYWPGSYFWDDPWYDPWSYYDCWP